jgi:hypothetical protein
VTPGATDRARLPPDFAIGLLPVIPDDIRTAAARLVLARVAEPGDAAEVLAALGLEGVL